MRYIIFLFFVSRAFFILAQSVDYTMIILPDNINEVEFEEKLVRLAWKNYPLNKISLIEQERSENNLNKASWNWLNRITISGNLNEFTINPDNFERSQFYPRYNFNVTIPLGVFVDQANDARIARNNVAIESEQVNQQKLTIRAEVLMRYEDYKRNIEVLKLRTKTNDDIGVDFALSKQKFQSGVIGIDEYNNVVEAYNRSQEGVILSQSALKVSKIRVEQLIGVKLEDVK